MKSKLFYISTRIPLIRETADPWIFLVLTALVVAAAFGIFCPETVFPGDEDARTHVIQVAAGMLLILGAYFTAVNIREARAQQSFDRLCKVIDQLGSDSETVRVGAIRLLESIALEKLDLPGGSAGQVRRARQKAILDALASVSEELAGSPSAKLARDVLTDLEAAGLSAKG